MRRALALLLSGLCGCVAAWDADGDGLVLGEDCDDDDPEITAPQPYFPDLDGDLYGDAEAEVLACAQPEGYRLRAGDCDDQDPSSFPEGVELCDDADNDCNGLIDDDPADPQPYWPDLDGDGYGGDRGLTLSCRIPAGYLEEGGDCDDSDPEIHPDAEEQYYDGVDQDCDRQSDYDADQDGADAQEFGGSDCDDEDESTAPGMPELCDDGVDQDCDGQDAGPCELLGTLRLVNSAAAIAGTAGSGLGLGMALLADADGDGAPDLAVGAPTEAEIIFDAGALAIVSGPLRGYFDLPDESVWMAGDSPGSQLGAAVVALDDVNGDGLSDVAVGLPGLGEGLDERGEVRLLASPFDEASHQLPFGVLAAADRDDRAGQALARGDVHGDGRAELVVAATAAGPEEQGAVYLAPDDQPGVAVLGQGGELLLGDARGDGTGASLAVADVDGDGVDDVAIGAPGADEGEALDAGRAYLVLGPPAAVVLLAEDAHSRFEGPLGSGEDEDGEPYPGSRMGAAVAAAGDLDGDGRPDLAIGAPEDSSRRLQGGGLWVFTEAAPGSHRVEQAPIAIWPHHEFDQVGSSAAGPGDVDGDGFDDLLVGAPGAKGSQDSRSGRAFLLFGPLDGTYRTWEAATSFAGERSGDGAGTRVYAPGDVDGDGLPELGVLSADTLHLIYGMEL